MVALNELFFYERGGKEGGLMLSDIKEFWRVTVAVMKQQSEGEC